MRIPHPVAAAVAALFAATTAQATRIELPEPGYLLIDSTYYGYGLRSAGSGDSVAGLSALDGIGFDFDTLPAVGDCLRADGGLPSLPGTEDLRLRVDDGASTSASALALDSVTVLAGGSRVALVACAGATVLLVRSGDGDLVCSEAIGLPLARGLCPALDAADPGYVYHDAFED